MNDSRSLICSPATFFCPGYSLMDQNSAPRCGWKWLYSVPASAEQWRTSTSTGPVPILDRLTWQSNFGASQGYCCVEWAAQEKWRWKTQFVPCYVIHKPIMSPMNSEDLKTCRASNHACFASREMWTGDLRHRMYRTYNVAWNECEPIIEPP